MGSTIVKTFFDLLAGTWGTILFIKAMGLQPKGLEFENPVINSFKETVGTAAGIASLVYLSLRIYHFWHNSKLDRQHKREDLKAKQRKNELEQIKE